MKLQHMIIIFLIIMLPLALIMSQYTSLQIDTLSAKTKCDTALLSATFDTMSAFELNTVNNKVSSVIGEEIRDLEAVISTFATSLSSNLGMSSASTDIVLSHVPAMVFGLYDGYYIYAQNDTGTGRELKPYVYYTKTYSRGSTNITISYSLDNYVSIYGVYNGKTISESGYLIIPSDVEISPDFAYVTTKDENLGTIKKVIDPGTKIGGQKSWVRYKGYDIVKETIYENETLSETDGTLINKSRETTDAMMYYYEALQFTKVYNEVVSNLNLADINTLYINSDNNPEDEYSAFMNEKVNVMKNSITKNLNTAIYNYEGGVSDNYEMPQLKGEDWEKILNNVSITAFLKDMQIGTTKYNNYVVVNSTTNQKYNSAKSIDFIEYVNDAHKGITSYGYYHKITCDELINNLEGKVTSQIIGYPAVDFERYRYSIEDSDDYFYYYKHNEYADYACEVETLENQNVATIEEYVKGKTTDTNTRNTILKAYYTAVGRIRNTQIKASSYINLDKPKSFAVRYYPNGGNWSKGNPEKVTTNIGKLSTISDTPSITGKIFMGWSTNPNNTVAEVKVGDTIYAQEGKTIDLYAVFADQYTITYHMNGGEGGPSPNVQTKISGVDYKIPTSKPKRDGRVFLGWSTNPAATTAEYKAGDIYTENKNLVLYAVWTNQLVKVQYNTKGGSVVPTQEKAVGATIKLEGTPVLLGSNFLGWSKTPTGTTPDYQPGSDYSENVDRTLYAIWNTTTYRITFNGNGGNLPSDLENPINCTKIYGYGYLIPSNKPVREGYNFIGWSKNPNDLAPDSNYAPGSVYVENENLTLYAIWEGNQYSIVYDANGGTNAPETQIANKNSDITITNSKPIRQGYTFKGWSTDHTDVVDRIQYSPGQNYSDRKSIKLYAVWEKEIYTITYDANGGINAPANQTKRYGENVFISSIQPSKADYYFVGWSRNRDSSTVEYYTNQVYKENESITLYAVWSVSSFYNITYYPNGGVGEPDAQLDIPIETNITISSIKPQREGHTFLGWSTNQMATVADTRYAPGTTYKGTSDLDLYAVWQPIRQSLTVNPNGGRWRGQLNSTTIATVQNASIDIEAPIPPTGFKFSEWIVSTGDAVIYYTEASYQVIMRSSSSTIVAKYEKEYYRITYNSNSPTPVGNMPASDYREYDTSIQISASNSPTRSGYRFLGWSESPIATNATYGIGSSFRMPARNMTLYAVWREEEESSTEKVILAKNTDTWYLGSNYNSDNNGYSDEVAVSRNGAEISSGKKQIDCTGYKYLKVRLTGDVEEGGPNISPWNYVGVGVGKSGDNPLKWVQNTITKWGPGTIGSGKSYLHYNTNTGQYDESSDEALVFIDISDLSGNHNLCIKSHGDRFGGPYGNVTITEVTLCNTMGN